ncbi:hypothetical protein [Dyella choica]|uniref:hypothetical protein n=1 Tax=Dyella choica TaxID=1927959 RepID=UPI0013158FAA|nr:hypothetical protein [Dyella choica]
MAAFMRPPSATKNTNESMKATAHDIPHSIERTQVYAQCKAVYDLFKQHPAYDIITSGDARAV